MNNKTAVVFAISKVGASHLPKGVPCQDYSLCVNDEDIQMIVVCDGHGSKTYVRSDVGSRLAAEVVREALQDFVKEPSHIELLHGKRGAVTSRPCDQLWGPVLDKPIESMTETELQNHEQEKLFLEQVKDIRDIDSVFKTLFESICNKWGEAIKKYSEEHPFTDSEKEALGNRGIEKAYGSTLMAFVKTQYYWLAFHIGDGRIITVDRHLDMVQPVPWDCNCFQNYTTSLCNSNPECLFRYAFDGTGSFPAAVFCCSDGIEDSYGDYEINPQKLHGFYQGLLDQFVKVGEETTLQNIGDFLPVLSEKGSRDDMSLAGIIDISLVENGLKEAEIKDKIAELDNQINELEKQKELLEMKLKNCIEDIESVK